MSSWLKTLLASSGSKNWKRDLLIGVCVPLLAGGLAMEWLGVFGLSVAVFVAVAEIEYEVLLAKSKSRQRLITKSWPIVLESLESAAVAGMSLLESLRDLAEAEQLAVTKEFADCCNNLDSGVTFDSAIDELKQALANPHADFTLELLRIANNSGSDGYVSALRNQSNSLRQEAAIQAQLDAKQGWVVGTAKLAVIAPWLIVTVLSIRPENAETYRSITGTALLLLGLLASGVALRIVYRIGNFAARSRVFQ